MWPRWPARSRGLPPAPNAWRWPTGSRRRRSTSRGCAARCEILSAIPLDGAAIARAAAIDRYERRVLSRRRYAMRRFDAAFHPAIAEGRKPASVASCRVPDRQNEPDGAHVCRTNPGSPCRGEACLAPTHTTVGTRRALAKRTRRVANAAFRSGRTNPTRAGRAERFARYCRRSARLHGVDRWLAQEHARNVARALRLQLVKRLH
jgi:hypothetical protein